MGEVDEGDGLSMKSEPLLSRDRLQPACALHQNLHYCFLQTSVFQLHRPGKACDQGAVEG